MAGEDRDALRARGDALAAQLAQERGRADAAQAEISRLQDRLAAVRAQLAAAPKRVPGVIGIVVATILVAAAGAVVFAARVEDAPDTPPSSAPTDAVPRSRVGRPCVIDLDCPAHLSCSGGRCQQVEPSYVEPLTADPLLRPRKR